METSMPKDPNKVQGATKHGFNLLPHWVEATPVKREVVKGPQRIEREQKPQDNAA